MLPLFLFHDRDANGWVLDLANGLLDLVFPPRCAVCRRPGAELCEPCSRTFTPLGPSCCAVCSTPLPAPGICARCQHQRPAYERVWSAFRFEGALREAVHVLKYKRRRALADPLAVALLEVSGRPQWAVDAVTAVPMHADREAARGYNHAMLLASALANRLDLPLLGADSLRRIRATETQVGRDLAARAANVDGAFRAADDVLGLRVLLIDDVCTTGATLDACARALLQAGAQQVTAATLARAMLSAGIK